MIRIKCLFGKHVPDPEYTGEFNTFKRLFVFVCKYCGKEYYKETCKIRDRN